MSPESFKEKRARLEQAKINLKEHFVGIDDIIDDIIEKITAWYLFPSALTRPLMINLWGLTGVGKTDLIRRLTKEIGFGDRFMEIQMTNKGDVGWEKSIREKLLSSDIEPGKPGVLLLDEIQRFRTIESTGEEIHDYNFQDVWMLLSDGKFSAEASIRGMITRIMCDMSYSEDIRRNGDPDDDDDDDIEEEVPKKKKAVSTRKYHMSYWRAQEFKKLLARHEDIEEIMKWDQEMVIQTLQKALNNADSYKETDYSKLLIFISGNLDEAFRAAAQVSDADQDADEVHKRTKKISIITIKNSLKRRFKPEQISRFGNVHVIYPSLSKASFIEIINRRLRKLEESLGSATDLSLKFDPSIVKCIYDNGVYASQGVRPVLSTIDDFVNQYAPDAIIEAIETNSKNILFSVSPDGERIISSATGGSEKIERSKTFKGILDEVRKKRKNNKDKVSLVAVHEAAHAIVYSVVYGIAPTQIIVNTTSENSDGATYIHDMTMSFDRIKAQVQTLMAGIAGEELVFGDGYQTNGASSDISRATSLMADYYRSWGGDPLSPGKKIDGSQDGSFLTITDMKLHNAKIDSAVKEAYSVARNILSENKDLFREVVRRLEKDLFIDPKEFAELYNKLAKPHRNYKHKTCEVISSEEEIIDGYQKKSEEFFKDVRKEERESTEDLSASGA